MSLTHRQQRVLDFYQNFITTNWYPPTYQEAGKRLKMSAPGVFLHVKKLKEKEYMDFWDNTKYLNVAPTTFKIPIIWSIACGDPIEVIEDVIDYVDVGKDMIKDPWETYGLMAKWNSMKNAGINDGDYLIIKKQDEVWDGEIGVVIDQSDDFEKATLKRVYHTTKSLMLKPENEEFPVTFKKQCEIRGKLVWVIRNFK